MLRVDVRELRQGPVETVGAIPPGDPLFQGLDLELLGPVEVSGTLEATGQGEYLWRGEFGGRVRSTCRRCLSEFETPVEFRVEVFFSSDPELLEDPSVYPLPEPPVQVDVTEVIREELALAVSAYPLCREECRGLCPRCGADRNLGPCECGPDPIR